jgi:nucleotide-binding universal stress UspA family protein
VKGLKKCGAKEVILLHVFDQVPDTVKAEICDPECPEEEDLPIAHTPEFCEPERLEEKCKGQLMIIENDLRSIGFTVRTMIKEGDPATQILKTEEEEDISVIVIGSHGRGIVEGVILGSISEKVIRKCQSPALVIRI